MTKEKTKAKLTKKEYEAETRKWISAELQRLKPAITDETHMLTALAMNSDYQIVRGYLEGNISDIVFGKRLVYTFEAVTSYVSNGKRTERPDRIEQQVFFKAAVAMNETLEYAERTFKHQVKLEQSQAVSFRLLEQGLENVRNELVRLSSLVNTGKAKSK